jgi:hypothetical protein
MERGDIPSAAEAGLEEISPMASIRLRSEQALKSRPFKTKADTKLG